MKIPNLINGVYQLYANAKGHPKIIKMLKKLREKILKKQ